MKFALHMDGSNSDFAPHMEGSHADFALYMERIYRFRDQKIAKIVISAKFLSGFLQTIIFKEFI